MKVLICTMKSWNIRAANELKASIQGQYEIGIITEKEMLLEMVEKMQPDYIFFPHWSYIIPDSVYKKYECIVFHITDLPYGRGGSPLQNLIVRGKTDTKISAIRVDAEIDAGAVYMKEELNLNGTAEEILIRAAKIIFKKMIPDIIYNHPVAIAQCGEVVHFKRRKPEESELSEAMNMQQIYDYIRMLDGEGYPKAFIYFGKYKIIFSRASLKNGYIQADVKIMEDENGESVSNSGSSR